MTKFYYLIKLNEQNLIRYTDRSFHTVVMLRGDTEKFMMIMMLRGDGQY
jgi:hypothetical protein